MGHQTEESLETAALPPLQQVVRVWRADRCLKGNSIQLYLYWIARYRKYCREHRLDERAELTRIGALKFAQSYARRRRLSVRATRSRTSHALHAWSWACRTLGADVPAWTSPATPRPIASPLLRAFASYLLQDRGNPDVTVRKKIDHVERLLRHLLRHRRLLCRIGLKDVDEFLIDCSRRYARATTADIACSVRSFLRYLRVTGRLRADLAPAVLAPIQRRDERPRRALPWGDVVKLLRAVDRSSARGLRDHAMLLLMATYGFGAGEVIRLRITDIDWTAATLHVVRPKTGVAFLLPLLPPVARVLAAYLQKGRPPHAPTRHLFVQMRMPHSPFVVSGAVRHIVRKHAAAAGINAPFLGSHVLRHSHAARQIELGAAPRVIGDILGHRDPESVSAYVRIATERLRDISLPVPG